MKILSHILIVSMFSLSTIASVTETNVDENNNQANLKDNSLNRPISLSVAELNDDGGFFAGASLDAINVENKEVEFGKRSMGDDHELIDNMSDDGFWTPRIGGYIGYGFGHVNNRALGTNPRVKLGGHFWQNDSSKTNLASVNEELSPGEPFKYISMPVIDNSAGIQDNEIMWANSSAITKGKRKIWQYDLNLTFETDYKFLNDHLVLSPNVSLFHMNRHSEFDANVQRLMSADRMTLSEDLSTMYNGVLFGTTLKAILYDGENVQISARIAPQAGPLIASSKIKGDQRFSGTTNLSLDKSASSTELVPYGALEIGLSAQIRNVLFDVYGFGNYFRGGTMRGLLSGTDSNGIETKYTSLVSYGAGGSIGIRF